MLIELGKEIPKWDGGHKQEDIWITDAKQSREFIERYISNGKEQIYIKI